VLSSKLPPTAEDGSVLADRSILDLGDVQPDDSIESFHRKLGETWRAARERAIPLALGGDHSISIPLIAAAGEWTARDFGMLWIDAHPDLCDVYQGSRNSHACVAKRALESPFLGPENVIMVGIRSYEVEEVEYLRSQPITVLTSSGASGQRAIDAAAMITQRLAGLPVYLSLDIDAFDPAFAPGTGIPDAGGLTTRWVLDLIHALAPLPLLGVDLVEVAPPLDVPSDATSLLALKVILELLAISN
jgi:agmatinase